MFFVYICTRNRTENLSRLQKTVYSWKILFSRYG